MCLTHVLHMPAVDLVICRLKANTGLMSSLLKAYLCKTILIPPFCIHTTVVTCNLWQDQEKHYRDAFNNALLTL